MAQLLLPAPSSPHGPRAPWDYSLNTQLDGKCLREIGLVLFLFVCLFKEKPNLEIVLLFFFLFTYLESKDRKMTEHSHALLHFTRVEARMQEFSQTPVWVAGPNYLSIPCCLQDVG